MQLAQVQSASQTYWTLDTSAAVLILGCVEQEQLPYDAGTLRLRLSGSNAVELQDMHDALSQRAREITSEMIALDAPELEYPGEPLLAYSEQATLCCARHATFKSHRVVTFANSLPYFVSESSK